MDITHEETVRIAAAGVALEGTLIIPVGAQGIVLFAHGSGSSRHSPRNQFVAEKLQERGLATLLVDLLTMDEEEIDRATAHLRFDVQLLAERLTGVTEWLKSNESTRHLDVGYFGASTGAAAALIAAAEAPERVSAVVSRGGRPDLAIDRLPDVEAPTLLIIGGRDLPVIPLNEKAFAALNSEKKLEIIPGATHLFEEAGALDEVAALAGDWFLKHLSHTGNNPSSDGRAARQHTGVRVHRT